MGKKTTAVLFAVIFGLIVVSDAQARRVWLDYTDGYVDRCDRYGKRDDIYSMRFDPQAAMLLEQVYFTAEDAGELALHVWPDRDGMPDLDRELIEPVTLTTDDGQKSYPVDLVEQNLVIDPPKPFHIGFVRLTDAGAKLCRDATEDLALRAKQRLDGDWEETRKDWIVLVAVDYRDEPTEFYFTDVTAQAGLDRLGSRMAWGDFDNDGDLDLLFSGPVLYENNGDGTFTDVTTAAGLDGVGSNGCVWADFDNDGDLDFFAMISSLENYDRFFRNNGDGTFSDITDTALVEDDHDLNPSQGAAWGDYDKDGYLDLYLANYEMPGDDLGLGTRDRLYHNNGDGTFTDVADDLSLDPLLPAGDHLCGRGVNWGDFNDDGWPDIHVSNYRLDPNLLYMNNGDGTFTDVALAKGVQGYEMNAAWGHTIGSAWGDFNNDGYLDLFNANLAHPRFAGFSDPSFLFLNDGPPAYTFTDFTAEATVIFIETNSEPCLGDFNNDGWLDLLVTNVYENFWQQLYRNDGEAHLSDVTYFSGLDIENGWGATFADFDNDGVLDLASNKGLYRGNANGNNYLQVQLEGNSGDPFCVGARVELQLVHDRGAQAREVSAGKGTTNGDPFVLHFGLNQCAQVWRVTAKFLSGKTVTLYEVAANQLIVINEDDASDSEPAEPGAPSTCADVDYSQPGWGDDDTADDDTTDDDDDDDNDDQPDDDDDDDDNDDDGCGC